MAVIFHVMEEERDRLNQAARLYRKNIADEIRKFKGSVKIRRRGNGEYLYLQRRDGQSVIDEYIGKLHSPKAARALASVNNRKKYEQRLKDVLNDLKDVERALRGKI